MIRRVVVRTGRWRGWVPIHMAVARALGRVAGGRGASVYVRGSLARGDLQPGFSDFDLAVVAGRRRARRPVRGVDLALYTADELAAACSGTTFVADAPVHLAGPPDEAGLRVRPGLGAPAGDWRRLRGPERRPATRAGSRAIAAWLELQFVWRTAFLVARGPRPDAAYACVKLVADPARIWLWLVHGIEVRTRAEALGEAARLLPQEREAIRGAQELGARLHADPPPDLAPALGALLRFSERIAAWVDAAAGSGEVVALGDGTVAAGRVAVPLADWRARAWPLDTEEWLAPTEADVADPVRLGELVRAARTRGPYPAIRTGALLVLPGPGLLRAVQCRASDPVSFAVLAGDSAARFPRLPGWSLRDAARRAADEHRAWLHAGGADPGRLASAARAALFERSVAAGAPELLLTRAAVGERLGPLDRERVLRLLAP